MDSARSWLSKFQPRDRLRAPTRKKDDVMGGAEDSDVSVDDESLSNVTKQKVAAAKQYIENHYKEQMKSLQERKERYISFHDYYFGTLIINVVSITTENFKMSLNW